MTEQEKRETAIEEIIDSIKEVRPSYGIILLRVCANVIYDIGYHKEEEVRRETLKNLFSSVSSFVETSMRLLGLELPVIRLNDLKHIIKNEFGVEVEK